MAKAGADLRELIEQVKERVEIEAVIGRRVHLQRRGPRLLGLCPFHAEKTPSFHVHPDKGFFKCFGCGKAGDVLTFVQEIDGMTFIEALRLLADEAGVEWPAAAGFEEQSPVRDQAREALRLARKLYQEALAAPGGAAAREYLRGRGIEAATLDAFGIGWAPAEPGWLSSRLARAGIPLDAMEEAGLAYRPEGGGRLRDRFWDRVMFPVTDRAGRTVGFGGRWLPGSKAEERKMGKYVNSPEGPLFPKRRLLYGLDRLAAALREHPDVPILVCEGYLDVILLHQAGFTTALAALGTSLTEDHSRALRRHGRTVALVLDPDVAGRRAAHRAARILVGDGLDVRVVELPEGQDPADLITAGRREDLSQCLARAWDIIDWRLASWSRKEDFQVPAVRARAAAELAEWIQTTPNPALAEVWARRAGDQLGLTEESLRRMARPRPSSSPQPAPPQGPPTPSHRSAQEVLARNEQEILAALLHDPSVYPRHRLEIERLRLRDPSATRILKWCQERRKEGLPFDLGSALEAFAEGSDRSWLDSIRLTRVTEPDLVLERALAAWEDNVERTLKEERRSAPGGQGGSEFDDAYLARYQRTIQVSPSRPRP